MRLRLLEVQRLGNPAGGSQAEFSPWGGAGKWLYKSPAAAVEQRTARECAAGWGGMRRGGTPARSPVTTPRACANHYALRMWRSSVRGEFAWRGPATQDDRYVGEPARRRRGLSTGIKSAWQSCQAYRGGPGADWARSEHSPRRLPAPPSHANTTTPSGWSCVSYWRNHQSAARAGRVVNSASG